jgi:TonB-dependent receptor
VNEIQTITIADTSIPTNPAFVGYSDATPLTTKGSYTIPLPSANFNWWVLPKLQLRLGVAETMTRPELNQLAPTRTDNALNRVYEVTYDGNANLRPIKAWQGDVSVEWYYQKNAALTMAIFGKKIKDFITQGTQNNVDIGAKGFFNGDTVGVPVLFTVYGPINGDKGYAEGIELSWEHVLENGLGVRAQYTHNWTKAYIDGQYVGQLEGVSPSTASLGGIYEAHHVSASLTWDYAGSFVAQTQTEVQGWSAISKPLSWVTATLGYEFVPGFKVYFEGRNLANAIPRTFLNGRDDAIWASGVTTVGSSVGQGYTAYGRTFMAGVSYRF